MRGEITFGADRAAVDRVTRQLAELGRLGVAFSGGVDSATLLALAVRALGPGQVVALLGVSPSLAADERAAAHDVARYVGVPVVEVETREGDRPEYRANGPDRCFHCKDELFAPIADEVLDRHGLDADRLRRERRRRAAARPARCAGGDAAPGAAPARRRRARQGGRPAGRAGARPAVRRQAGGAVPGVADPAPRAGDAGEARAGRGRRAGAAGARVHRLPGAPPRRRRPGRAARRGIARAAVPSRCATTVHRAVAAAGFRFVAVDLAGIQSGAFTLPLVTVGAMADGPARPGGGAGRVRRASTSTGPAAAATRRPSTARARRPSRSGHRRRPARSAGAAHLVHPRHRRARRRGPRASCPTPPTPPTAACWPGRPSRRSRSAAGSSWSPPAPPTIAVAREALLTARHLGRAAELVMDVGVAGLHRVLGRLDAAARGPGDRRGRRDGRGAARRRGRAGCGAGGGRADVGRLRRGVRAAWPPLLTMLNSCAPGVAVVNIDNGYGAGHLAAQIAAPCPAGS